MKHFLLFLAFASPAAFAKKTGCEFKLSCEQEKSKFSISFKSKSGDCDSDDDEITFSLGKESRRLELKPAWYSFTSHIAKNLESLCSEGREPFAAYSAGVDKALLFLLVNARPGYDRVLAVLLDTKEGVVLDSQELGETKNTYLPVLPHKSGFKTRVVRPSLSFHKEVTCDCDAPFVDDWMVVQIVKGGKIVNGWLKK